MEVPLSTELGESNEVNKVVTVDEQVRIKNI